MAQADLIPAGRTSRIVRGDSEIQIQTEYAYRPNPRLTTSLFNKGRLINKVEKELAAPVTSFEDKLLVEDMLRKQHMEVLKVLRDKESTLDFISLSDTGAISKTVKADSRDLEVIKKIVAIPGVEKVFRLDNQGNFLSSQISQEFRKKYSLIFRSIYDVINIFSMMPGGEREKGVYEIERDRLYFASSGRECYFVLVKSESGADFEPEIKKAVQ